MTKSKFSTTSVLWLLAFAFLFTQLFNLPSEDGRTTCKPIIRKNRIKHTNDVTLEFERKGVGCTKNHSDDTDCANEKRQNITRVIVNGKVERILERYSNDNEESRHRNFETKRNMKQGRRRTNGDDANDDKLALLGCIDIEKRFQQYDNRKDVSDDGFSEIYGTLDHPSLGKLACVLKQATSRNRKSFERLLGERAKRLSFGTSTKISDPILGECYKPDELRIIVAHNQAATPLCDGTDEYEGQRYTESMCFRNEKLKNLIEKSDDKARSSFIFIKELLCLFAEIEDKKLFVTDIHGKHLVITPGFSVFYKNIDILTHHGSRNILSAGGCKFDEDCPAPNGELWNNMSANYGTYVKCRDSNPSCLDNSCAGYNANLHICGIGHWILQPLYQYFTRRQDRSRITSVIMSTINSWPNLRSSSTESCRKVTGYYELYEQDMRRGVKGNARGFHAG